MAASTVLSSGQKAKRVGSSKYIFLAVGPPLQNLLESPLPLQPHNTLLDQHPSRTTSFCPNIILCQHHILSFSFSARLEHLAVINNCIQARHGSAPSHVTTYSRRSVFPAFDRGFGFSFALECVELCGKIELLCNLCDESWLPQVSRIEARFRLHGRAQL